MNLPKERKLHPQSLLWQTYLQARDECVQPSGNNMTRIRMFALAVSVIAALLAGCGGGGGGGNAAPVPTTEFPVLAGYQARISAGAADNFNVSGICTGTASIVTDAATPVTFNGVQAFAAPQTVTVGDSNCGPAHTVSGTSYFNVNYTPLGSSIPGGEYIEFVTPPLPLPAKASVGDSGDYATLATFVDETKAVSTGKRVLSYVIGRDTINTAIVVLVTKGYNTSDQLIFTQFSRYRIEANGSLTLIVIDNQPGSTGGAHLLYTKV